MEEGYDESDYIQPTIRTESAQKWCDQIPDEDVNKNVSITRKHILRNGMTVISNPRLRIKTPTVAIDVWHYGKTGFVPEPQDIFQTKRDLFEYGVDAFNSQGIKNQLAIQTATEAQQNSYDTIGYDPSQDIRVINNLSKMGKKERPLGYLRNTETKRAQSIRAQSQTQTTNETDLTGFTLSNEPKGLRETLLMAQGIPLPYVSPTETEVSNAPTLIGDTSTPHIETRDLGSGSSQAQRPIQKLMKQAKKSIVKPQKP